jgi:hypothetical protein
LGGIFFLPQHGIGPSCPLEGVGRNARRGTRALLLIFAPAIVLLGITHSYDLLAIVMIPKSI